MNFFEIDFLGKMAALLKEAFKFKKYKAMHPVLAVFTGILMLPIVVASFAVTAALACLGFLFSFIAYPVRYLHEIVHDEGQTIKHATQAVIYFISWPFIFLLYSLISFLLMLLVPTYALFMFLTYVWSLGGFKFHLFANYAGDIAINVEGRYKLLPLMYVIVGGMVAFFIPLVHGIIHYADLYQAYLERLFFPTFFGGIYPVYLGIHIVFTVLYTLIGFVRHPKKKPAIDAE